MIKRIMAGLLCCIMAFMMFTTVQAADIENEKKYDPLDLVVVVDNSGSMAFSDSGRTAPAAVRMLVNMMPADDSRVAVVGFNTKPTVLTKDTTTGNALIALENFAGVETIRDGVRSMAYKGGTGIGNAVYEATEILKKESQGDRTKAIILFTDGVNDFDFDKIAESNCDSNEVSAIKWAKENKCAIYCAGYDYTTPDGKSSMGADGIGLKKLQNIADSTGGKFKTINDIAEIEELLIQFMADMIDLIYTRVKTIPGDGKLHECEIEISPSVVEANIRIAGGGADAIKNGKVHLYDPNGNEITLANSGNVRYDVDAMAASIKVIMPKKGKWLLTVEGIVGDDIHIGLLEHFKMNISSIITLPEGNPDGVAYTNDTVGIKTWLSYDGLELTDSSLYDAVTAATAVCVSRANPDDKNIVNLTRDGLSFVGSFVIPEDSFYDITVRIEWNSVYREDTLTVQSSNKPLELVGKLEDIKVVKGKTVTVDNIYQYVQDKENDKITATASVMVSDLIDAAVDNDKLNITAKKDKLYIVSSSLVTVTYSDEQGNTVSADFKVSAVDPVGIALVVFTILLIIGIIVALSWYVRNQTLRITGGIRVKLLARGYLDKAGSFTATEIKYAHPNADSYNYEKEKESAPVFGGSPTDPFGASSDPFASSGSDPFASSSGTDPFASASSDPFASSGSDPFTSAGSDPFGGNSGTDPFGTSGTTGTESAGQDIFTTYNVPDWMKKSTAEGERLLFEKWEIERCLAYDEVIQIGKNKKNTLFKLIKKFAQNFSERLDNPGDDNTISTEAGKFVNSTLSYLDSFKIIGTAYGKSGIVFKGTKRAFDKAIFHKPAAIKDKVAVKPDKNVVKVSVSIITAPEKDSKRECVHLEFDYIKKIN